MQRYYTMSRTDDVHFGQIDCSGSEQPIFIGSPFFGFPSRDAEGKDEIEVNPVLLLDLNIVNFLRSRKNSEHIKRMLAWAAATGVEMTPIVAQSEQQRSHADPEKPFRQYVQALKEDYGYTLPSGEISRLLGVFEEHSPAIEKNTGLFRDYLVIIKHFYHQKASVEEKIKGFADLIYERNVPVLAFAFLLGCVYFFVKEKPSSFTEKVVRKVQSDMAVVPAKEEARLWNVASDIMLFMAPAELFYNKYTGEYNFCYVASADITAALAMSEICYGQVVVNAGRCFGHPGLRPAGISAESIAPLVQKYLRQSPQQNYEPAKEHDLRRQNLEGLALELRKC